MNKKKLLSPCCLAALVILSVLVISVIVCLKPANDIRIIDDKKTQFDFLTHWKQGNIALLIRHAERCDRSDEPCVNSEVKEGITVKGKEAAIEMGQNMQFLLPNNNSEIYNSPVQRTEQTAQYLFNGRSVTQSWLRKDCKKGLLNKVISHKSEGKNLILVSHATCFKSLGVKEGQKIIQSDITNNQTYGTTYVLSIDKKNNQAYMLGYISPEDWSGLNNR